MTGEEFRSKVGGVVKKLDEGYSLERKGEFVHVAKTLKVIGRANPLDKHILVTGLKEQGKVVSVTGEGINDVDALSNA
jgi:Ca2+ transporting ATPase